MIYRYVTNFSKPIILYSPNGKGNNPVIVLSKNYTISIQNTEYIIVF